MGLGGRLALTFAVLVALTAVLIGGASYVTTDHQVTGEIDGFLRQRADEIISGQRPPPAERSDRNPRYRNTVVVSVEADSVVQLLDRDASIDSNSGFELPVDDRDIDIATAPSSRPPVVRTITVDGADYRMITAHLPGGGAVQVARSLGEAHSLLAALAAAVGWILARRTTRPLRSLSSAVDAVAETQDFTVPVTATGGDEVGRLARGFDRMLKALDVSRQQQRRLVQDAAHELRTPLTSIKANIDWLARAEHVDADVRAEAMGSVQRELGELNDVIDEIITLATEGHELPPFEPIDLAVVTDTAVERFRARSDRAVTLRAVPSPVVGDPDSLGRAITNLLTNADKYSPTDAPISVDVARGAVRVTDQGAGIPEHERAKVFDRFYRRPAHRAHPGSGLGLTIVATIVEAHGGSVDVTEADGGGASVGFSLPATSAS